MLLSMTGAQILHVKWMAEENCYPKSLLFETICNHANNLKDKSTLVHITKIVVIGMLSVEAF